MMTRSISILAALLAGLLAATGSLAQGVGIDSPDPAMLAQRCVAHMEQIADRATGAIGDATQETIGRIARLDRAGASDEDIIAAGRRGTQAVANAAMAGSGRVTRVERHCVAVLTRLGADRALIQRVRSAAEGFREDIGMAGRRGVGAIRDAVARAIRG
jgi:hypothetical protein